MKYLCLSWNRKELNEKESFDFIYHKSRVKKKNYEDFDEKNFKTYFISFNSFQFCGKDEISYQNSNFQRD